MNECILAATMSEFTIEMKNSIEALLSATHHAVATTAGCELFMRFIGKNPGSFPDVWIYSLFI